MRLVLPKVHSYKKPEITFRLFAFQLLKKDREKRQFIHHLLAVSTS